MILVQFATCCEPDTMLFVHTEVHLTGTVILLLIRVTVDSTWRGGGGLWLGIQLLHIWNLI